MQTIVIFEKPDRISNKKVHDILVGILTFILAPVVNIAVINSGKESALYNSLSRLAWPEGLLWLIYIWGLINTSIFLYVTILINKSAGYNKKWRKAFIAIPLVSLFLMTVGISIPSYGDRGDYYNMLRTIHTSISCVGFFGFFVAILIIMGTLWTKYKKQALILSLLATFTLIIGVFSLTCIYDPASYCTISAPAQIIIFCMYHVDVGVTYYTLSLKDKKDEDEEYNTFA